MTRGDMIVAYLNTGWTVTGRTSSWIKIEPQKTPYTGRPCAYLYETHCLFFAQPFPHGEADLRIDFSAD